MTISNVSNGLRSGVCTSTTRPTAPYEGQIIYETDTNRVLVWDNAAWVMIANTDQPPGLQLISTKTFSASSGVNFNSVFSSSFDNYCIVGNLKGSVGGLAAFRVRSGTTDRTNYDYAWSRHVVSADGATNARAGVYGDSYMVAGNYGINYGQFSIDVTGPYLSQYTNLSGTSTEQSGSMFYQQYVGGISTANASFDGFSLLPTAGNITGSVSVYGYRK